MKAKRQEWHDFQKTADSGKLVFLDESGVNIGMTRLYGRARSQDRVVEAIPNVRFHRTTVLSSIRWDGTLKSYVFEGALSGEYFKKYIDEFLAPSLSPGDSVVMDNLSSHKLKGVSESIRAVGAEVLYLPPYSPDLNPVELMWSKMKAILCKMKIRSKDLLGDAIENALNSVTTSDISGWFRHDGYCLCY